MPTYAQILWQYRMSLRQQLLKPTVEKLTMLDSPKTQLKLLKRASCPWAGKRHNTVASSTGTADAAKTNNEAAPILAAI